MSRTFRYIQNDDVLKSFKEFRDTLLSERPVIIARHGDYSLFMEKKSDNELGLRIMNDEKKSVVGVRTYDVNKTTDALVSRGVRHACQKMSELSDEDVNTKRFQIWKWYLLDYQKNHEKEGKQILNKELTWDEEWIKKETDLMDMEKFLHGAYLNMGNTLALIDKYISDPSHKELFRKFAVNDIMEMTREDTKEKSLEDAELRNQQQEELKHHTYQFTVSVEATDREHARQALLHHLAGDERISVQK
ncbi:hypothetical protein [Butyrivibrio sp. VCB2006]|uniref:hypothetical protein n=1 Tax=Butyrivibrio sp. VCB2006 TaxID=1280679 RepID=UPI0004925620|nr:hypothetical protein [Butyrivibrio sp. VCB2006]